MNFLKKYKLRNINYNFISKINCINLKYLPNELVEIQLRISNKYINSQYNLILILLLLQFITKQKAVILKNKKDQLYQGLKKNDCLNGYLYLRKQKLNDFLLDFINDYLVIIDFNRLNLDKCILNILNFNLTNINKIDKKLIKENKYNNTNFKLNIVLKQFLNRNSTQNIANNINILLSHLTINTK